jgi:hypothetical protein
MDQTAGMISWACRTPTITTHRLLLSNNDLHAYGVIVVMCFALPAYRVSCMSTFLYFIMIADN